MRLLICSALFLALLPSVTVAQPRYEAQFLGEFAPGRISERGEIPGRITISGAERAVIVRPGAPPDLLPLPAGMVSSSAVDLNESGVIVGAVSASTSTEFSSRAAVWEPDGQGGYTTRLLGALPGHGISRATAVNNIGDIVGYSSNGTYRYPVLFTAPEGVLDLSATGVFDPVDINDGRVLVDHSFTAKRLDLDTMIAEDLGAPNIPGGPRYIATRAEVINESGQVAGAAILATSTSCDRQAARYSDSAGWQIFSVCGPYNTVCDMNDQGDMVMRLNLANYVVLEGAGTFQIEDLIVPEVGHWYLLNSFGVSINNARHMVVWGSNPTTGQSGPLLLTPETPAAIADSSVPPPKAGVMLVASPNPFNPQTTIRYDLSIAATVTVTIHDATGRLVRRLVDQDPEQAGTHSLPWDGRDANGRAVASGVYACHLVAGHDEQTSQLVLVR